MNTNRDMNYLVSIIVPIYNVEQYLRRCVDSILSQTYSNLEIILVDDGSPDECPRMCDEYARIDERVRVIHKDNGGLSSARNAGLDIMNGNYVMFIDSDDYLAVNTVECILEESLNYCADIVTFKFVKVYDDHQESTIDTNKEIRIWSGKQALVQMFYSDGIGWEAWNKLYKAELFSDIRYVEDVLMEDMATTYKVFELCDKVVETSYKLYFYYIRQSSIMRSSSPKKAIDSINNMGGMCEYFKKKHPDILYAPCAYLGKTAPYYLVMLVNMNESLETQRKCIDAIRNYYKFTCKAKFVQKKFKCITLGFRLLIGNTGYHILEKKWFTVLCHKLSRFV